ncbi:MAG: NAD(P)H-hydrate dehydratase [Gemmobacter sp.]
MTPDSRLLIDRLRKREGQHKYAHGHALILSGGPGQGGAARLAARGALRIGAGLVTLGCPLPALAENSARMDTVMLRAVHDGAALARVLEDRRYNALCLGPGMGFERARDLVPVALRSGRGVVVDADALSAYGADPAALFAFCSSQTVLTPHGGEFARLFPDLSPKLPSPPAKVEAARRAAERAGAVVLYKGHETVIAAPDGRVAVSDATGPRAAPWLATAGSGDVLAGFITGLLARGFEAMEAAECATFLHLEAARSFGPGLIAEDLPEELPRVFRALGL